MKIHSLSGKTKAVATASDQSASTSEQQKEYETTDTECLICMEDAGTKDGFGSVAARCCGQTFCKACLTKWVDSRPGCPKCRNPDPLGRGGSQLSLLLDR